jgi:hypothetical protein
MACFLPSWYNFIACRRGRGTSLIDGRGIVPVDKAQKSHWRSIAVEVVSKPEICQGAECLLRAAVRIRVLGYALVLVSGSVSCKKHDKQLTFIVRVMCCELWIFNISNNYLSILLL